MVAVVLASAGLFIIIPGHTSAQTVFLTTGTTWTVPADWNNLSNYIETVGGGSGGGGGGQLARLPAILLLALAVAAVVAAPIQSVQMCTLPVMPRLPCL